MSPLTPGDPVALGFDPDRLGRIGPAMQTYVDEKRVPNLVTLIARRGQIVHLDARGVLSFETGEPATPDSLFRMFSNTKPLAGVATCILYERGVLNPDDPVSRFLPEFGDMRVQVPNAPGMTERAKREITVRDCLTNTTGLLNPGTMPAFYREQYKDVFARIYDGVDALKMQGWMRRPLPHAPHANAFARSPNCRSWRTPASPSNTTSAIRCLRRSSRPRADSPSTRSFKRTSSTRSAWTAPAST